MKKCNLCDNEKPLDEFGDDSNTKDGKRSDCLDCQRARARAYRKEYYQKNKDKIKTEAKARYHSRKKVNESKNNPLHDQSVC